MVHHPYRVCVTYSLVFQSKEVAMALPQRKGGGGDFPKRPILDPPLLMTIPSQLHEMTCTDEQYTLKHVIRFTIQENPETFSPRNSSQC